MRMNLLKLGIFLDMALLEVRQKVGKDTMGIICMNRTVRPI